MLRGDGLLLWDSGYRRRSLDDIGYLPFPVRKDVKRGLDSLGKIQHSRRSPRTKFPLTETLNKFLETLDNFGHTRAFGWIILNHVVNERSHKFEGFVSADVGKNRVSLRESVKRTVRSNDDLTCMNSVRMRLPT